LGLSTNAVNPCSIGRIVRVVRFVGPDGPRLGVVEREPVVDLTAVDPDAPRDLRKVLS
jgi:hypothetical protein